MEKDSIRFGDSVSCGICEDCQYKEGEVLEVSLDANYSTVAKVAWPHGEISYWDLEKLRKVTKEQKHEGPCRHEFRDYRGFTQDYKFCVKCDLKVPH